MLSKAKGQILRVSACLSMLYTCTDDQQPWTIPLVIQDEVIMIAEDFVDVCCQHAAYLAGREDTIEKEIEKTVKLYEKHSGMTPGMYKIMSCCYAS